MVVFFCSPTERRVADGAVEKAMEEVEEKEEVVVDRLDDAVVGLLLLLAEEDEEEEEEEEEEEVETDRFPPSRCCFLLFIDLIFLVLGRDRGRSAVLTKQPLF